MLGQSNGIAVHNFAPLRDSTGLDDNDLRRRLRTDGYVYLRGVLDREDVLGLRELYFRQFPLAYLKTGTTPRDGVWSGRRAGLPPHGVLEPWSGDDGN